jgi:hypothetical protein
MQAAFLIIQMCCFFTIYSAKIPSNTEVYLDEFRSLITFQIANPKKIIAVFFPNFNLDEQLAA